MLPKNKRISRELFTKAFENTKVFHSSLLTLRVNFPKEQKDAKLMKFSFVVSTKVAKKAVERNLLRRRGYSIARGLLETVRPGIYMFFFKKEAKDASFADLKKEIHDTISKLEK